MANNKNIEQFSSTDSIGTYLYKMMPKSKAFIRSKFSSMSEMDVEEIFGNSEIALFEKVHKGEIQVAEGKIKVVKEGKLEDLRGSLLTYFNSVTWFQGLKFLRDRGCEESYDEGYRGREEGGYDTDKLDELLGLGDDGGQTSDQSAMMRDIVKDLPHPCEEILWSYYGDDLDMATIAQLIGSRNANVAKQQKARCMSKLRARFEQIKSEFYETKA